MESGEEKALRQILLQYISDASHGKLQFKGKPLTPEQSELIVDTLGCILADANFEDLKKEKS